MSDIPIALYSEILVLTKTTNLTIQISHYKWVNYFNIFKSTFSDRYTGIAKGGFLRFSYDDACKFLTILENIPENPDIAEYGMISDYKVFTWTHNGHGNFQIRQWVVSQKYEGFGKQWISISLDKLSDFKAITRRVISFFHDNQDTTNPSTPSLYDPENIDSYFL